ADARLAAEENHLPFPSRRPLPAVEQQGQLGRATDERFRCRTVKRLEPAFGLTEPEHAEDFDRRGQTLERLSAQILELEQTAEQAPRTLADDHLIGIRERLKTSSEIRRVADDSFLLGRSLTDQVAHDDHTGGDADPRRKPFPRWCGDAPDRVQDPESRADGALRLVLMCPGPAE